MRSSGTEAHALTNDPLYHHSAFSWSPDGRWLAFMRVMAAEAVQPPEIWIIGADGSGARKLAGWGYLPAWSP